jgi:hypothetical protein
MQKSTLVFLLVFIFNFGFAQVLGCDLYYIFDVQDTVDAAGDGVFFRMWTDTNTYNTGYTDMLFVDQNFDSVTVDSFWGNWLPSMTVPNDTLWYILYYRDGVDSFTPNFNGQLITRNPGCIIYYNEQATSIEEEGFLPEYFLFPNPANEFVRLHTEIASQAEFIEIFDLSGKEVIEVTDPDRQIYVRELPSGFYILKAYQGGLLLFSEKFQKVD